MTFAEDMHLSPSSRGEDGGSSAWDVDLKERWNVGRNQNGGILLATMAGAMAASAGHPHPFAVTGHYLAAAEAGAAHVSATTIKPGRTYATAEATLTQGDRTRVRAIGAFGDLRSRAAEGQSLLAATPPAIPRPDECDDLFEKLVSGPAGAKALTRSIRNFEIRVDRDGGWCPGGEASLRGWIRMRDESTVSPQMLVAIADGFPPTLMGATEIGWLPTIELTVHVFAEPAPELPWLMAVLRTRQVIGGLLDEDGELWDGTGRLVARFRQLALLLPRS